MPVAYVHTGGVIVSNSYTFQILDADNLVSAALETSIAIDAYYVINLVSRYIGWNGTMDFAVRIRPGHELTWSDADGLLPSIVQTSWNGSAWVNDTLNEALTGVDRNPSAPDAGLTIYLSDDGTIRNYGSPVWFDPNPEFEVDPAIPAGMHDFVGILTHEIFHSLGFIYYTKEWSDRITVAGDVSYFNGAQTSTLFGGALPFQTGYDHYGYAQNPAITISRGLMYQFGNYEQNRFDIGRIDLGVLADLGYSIKTYSGLPLFEFIDTASTNVVGTGADETLYGDYHDNVISGNGGNDRIEAGAGNDNLRGGDGNDQLFGDSDDDNLRGGRGVDSFDGGTDSGMLDLEGFLFGDKVSFYEQFATQGVIADLRTGIISNDGFGNVETMVNIESLGDGTAYADTFYGNDNINGLWGSFGDFLYGFGSMDFIQLSGAPVVVDGGDGDDMLILLHDGAPILPDSNGDGLHEVEEQPMTVGWKVDLGAGTILDGYGHSGSVAGIENVLGSEIGDELRGGAGADFLDGRGGDDLLEGRDGDDTLQGGAGADELIGGAGIDYLYGSEDDDDLDGGDGNDSLYGAEGNDIVRGGAGNDSLYVWGLGTDQVEGGAGNRDNLLVSYYDDTTGITMTQPGADPNGGFTGSVSGGGRTVTYSGVEILSISTGSGNDVLWGGGNYDAFANVRNFYNMGAGDDLFYGMGGTDTVDAGEGIDGFSGTMGVFGSPVFWSLQPTTFPGIHNFYTGFEYFLSLTTGSGQDSITTANLNLDDNITLGTNGDSVTLWNGHDTVNGGAAGAGATNSGLDTLVLNYGLATTGVHNVGALTSNAAGYSGQFADDSTRLATFEAIDRFLIATGSGADNITTGDGNDEVRTGGGNDVVATGGGNDLIDGGSGDDSMTGGTGNDIYVVSSAGDVVTENAGEGTDEVRTALAAYTLGANVEQLTGTSAAGQNLTANAGDNLVRAAAGNDVLHLEDGGVDVVNAGDGDDQIHFGESLRAEDQVDGGAGFDTLFLLGNYSAGVTLNAGTLKSIERITLLTFGQSGYRLVTHDLNLAAGQTLQVDGSGLGAFETLYFDGRAETDGNFSITGGAATDVFFGGSGNDVFSGGGGTDRFFGGAGADTMTGGTGDDYYQVDQAGDVVIEAAGEGTDRIDTNLAVYSLASTPNVEDLAGGLAAGQTLTGNGLANVITGFTGNDVIDGGAGADEMRGAAGNDVYMVDDAGDKVFEYVGEGSDEIRTALASYSLAGNPNVFNVENLTATSDVNHDFRGSSANNVITGGSGNDVLRLQDGGDDTVLAGAGMDNIFFIGSLTSADVVNGGSGIDTLVLQGAYAALVLTANITQIENISLLAGSNTAFGEPG
ncbi:MAG TPA: calcium-binding protein, partial [Allosphingosinicella sp.]|nr:calcium-binding protein [Allosphingosinicella sp.]